MLCVWFILIVCNVMAGIAYFISLHTYGGKMMRSTTQNCKMTHVITNVEFEMEACIVVRTKLFALAVSTKESDGNMDDLSVI